MEATYKTCSKCNEELILSEFYKDSTRKDGLRPICKSCTKSSRKKKSTKLETTSIPDGHKRCNCCSVIKPVNAFYKSGNRLRYICMECDNLKRTEKYESKNGKTKETQDIGKLALALSAVAEMITQKKICNTCNMEKDLEEFRTRNRNINGLSNKCKDCFRRERETVSNEEDLVFIKELENRQKYFETLVKRKKDET